MNPVRVGVLTTLGAVLTVPMIQALRAKDILPGAVICDGKMTDASAAIVNARLDRSFRQTDISDIDLIDVPTYFVKNHNSTKTIDLVKDLKLDYLVNAGTPRILKTPILAATRGVINCHPGILPKYRGCTVLEWSIHNGDPVGATAHFMVEGIDEGPIITTGKMTIARFESYEAIRTRMIGFQAELMAAAVKMSEKDNLLPEKMSRQPEGHYHKPIPIDELLAVKAKLARGDYHSS